MRIVFTKSKKRCSIGSKLIMWWTKKPYSHVARDVPRRNWGSAFYHASEGNVNYEHETVFHRKHEIIKQYDLKVSHELDMSIKQACWEDCGKKYGILQNVGIFLVDLGLFKDTPWKDGRNCSELIYIKVLKKMIPSLDHNPDTIKPHHLEEIILKHFEQNEDGQWYLNS